MLLTTNPHDFTQSSKTTLIVHQEIASDLAGTKAQLRFEWDWAAAFVLSKA